MRPEAHEQVEVTLLDLWIFLEWLQDASLTHFLFSFSFFFNADRVYLFFAWPSSETNVRSTERSENKEELSSCLSPMEFSDRRKTFSQHVICFQPTSPTSQGSCDSLATVSHTINWQVLSSFVIGFHTVGCQFNHLKPPSHTGHIRIQKNCDGRVNLRDFW